jgi:hypothetical protein
VYKLRQDKTTESLTVEITATISVNKDGTWHILNFGKEQKVIDEGQRSLTEWDKKRAKLIKKGEIDKRAYPTSWHLANARKKRARPKKYNRGDNHCSICGMKNKNKLTCLSVIDINGKLVNGEQRHRKAITYVEPYKLKGRWD